MGEGLEDVRRGFENRWETMQNTTLVFLTAPHTRATFPSRVIARAAVTQTWKEAMRDSKFGLRAFGLALVAALGLMAFMAVAAQAENLIDGGKTGLFLVEKKGELAKPGVTFEANQVGKGTLGVQGRNLAVLCEVGTIKGEFLSDVEALGSAEFSKCSAWTWVNLEIGKTHTTKLPCTVDEPIKVKRAKAFAKLHKNAAGETEKFVLLGEDEEDFTTLVLLGAECTLPEKNLITGGLVVKVDNSDTVNPVVLALEEFQTLLGDKLLFGAFAATLKGEANVKLTGSHVGKTVGVC
jgi:hypothetical protein